MKKNIIYELERVPILVKEFETITCDLQEGQDFFDLPFVINDKILELEKIIGEPFKIKDNLAQDDCGKYGNRQNKTCYSFFVLSCPVDSQVLLLSCMEGRQCKFWVDGRFIGIDRGIAKYFFELERGHHIFIYEGVEGAALEGVQVRINTVKNEICDEFLSLITSNMYYNDIPEARFLEPDKNEINNYSYGFMITPFDHANIDISQNVEIAILRKDDLSLIERFETQFYKLVNFEFTSLLENNVFIEICASWQDKSNKKHFLRKTLYFGDYTNECNSLVEKCMSIVEDETRSEEEKCGVVHYCQDLLNQKRVEPVRLFHIKSVVRTIEAGTFIEGIHEPGTKRICYMSGIDGTVSFYSVFLPQNYNINKTYPLLIRISTVTSETYSRLFRKDQWDDLIVVDIPIRGVTSGSYIGEYAFKEALTKILSRYNIDTSRIYAWGYSNGATAVWSLAQNYPDLFAGVLVYGGQRNKFQIKNLRNVKVFQIESREDEQFRNINKPRLPHHHLIYAKGYNHVMLKCISVNSRMIRELTKCRKEKPSYIFFCTYRNRNRRAFWVSISSIAPSKKNGRVKAQVESGNVFIKTINISGVTISLIPGINRNGGMIYINGKLVKVLNGEDVEKLSFVKTGGGFCESFVERESILYHGTGLLDVFLGPLKIVNCCPHFKEMVHAAKAFAKPRVNTYKPNVEVSYPIFNDFTLLGESFNDSNFIVLDQNSDNEFLPYLRQQSKFLMQLDGFYYKGKFYAGEYCIMQIMQNPRNKERSVLYINASDSALFYKNVLTRSVMIPTYLNQSIWNNDAVILYNDSYYSVFDIDAMDDIQKCF